MLMEHRCKAKKPSTDQKLRYAIVSIIFIVYSNWHATTTIAQSAQLVQARTNKAAAAAAASRAQKSRVTASTMYLSMLCMKVMPILS